MTGKDYAPRTTGGTLEDAAGTSHERCFLLLRLPRVSLRSHHERFVNFRLTDERSSVPFVVKVESDDMAPEVPEIRKKIIVGVEASD